MNKTAGGDTGFIKKLERKANRSFSDVSIRTYVCLWKRGTARTRLVACSLLLISGECGGRGPQGYLTILYKICKHLKIYWKITNSFRSHVLDETVICPTRAQSDEKTVFFRFCSESDEEEGC
ncbi:hypothetical protein J6590_060169 [Homalodisca vitripennis]|nr:hypothetical protein J6590_060169 [Homalodisca vitripennis]